MCRGKNGVPVTADHNPPSFIFFFPSKDFFTLHFLPVAPQTGNIHQGEASLTLCGVFGENKALRQKKPKKKTWLHAENVQWLGAATGVNMKQLIIPKRTSPRTPIRQQTFPFNYRFHEGHFHVDVGFRRHRMRPRNNRRYFFVLFFAFFHFLFQLAVNGAEYRDVLSAAAAAAPEVRGITTRAGA